MSRIKTFLMCLSLIVLAGASCQRKELLEPHDHNNIVIRASFDSLALSQLLSNKSAYSNVGEPRTTSYILYEKNSGKVAYRGSFSGLEGGMHVEQGLYDILVYTTDFNEYDANFFIGMDNPFTAETHTRQSPIEPSPVDEADVASEETQERTPRSDVKEMWMVEPDPTFSVLLEDIPVFQNQENRLVEAEFVQKSFKYYLTIQCTGLQNILSAKMNISGMYTTAFLSNDDHRQNEAGTQTLDMQIFRTKPTSSDDIGKGELYGEFWSFGPNQREDIVNTITLYFVNGTVITKKLNDLTSQIKTLTKGGEIIVEEIVEIKGPPGGFQPGVEDWGDNKDIYITI